MIQFHPLADIFPLIEGADFDALVADVLAHGVRDPIVILEGQILDGRNRYRAAQAARIYASDDLVPQRDFSAEFEGDPLTFVISKNVHRRHLNESQRAMVAARIETFRHGGGRDRGQESNLALDAKPSRASVTRAEAANLMRVSRASVTSAAVVRDQAAPELVAAVDRGEIAVSAAAKAVVMPAEKQRAIAEAAAAGKANVVNAEIKKAARHAREAELGAKITALPVDDGAGRKFGVVMEDPEWDTAVRSRETGMDRHQANHYPVSSLEEICARPVSDLMADDCAYLLWCKDLVQGFTVMRARGCKLVSYIVWVKDIVEVELSPDDALRIEREYLHRSVGGVYAEIAPPGLGFWVRDRDELLLIGTRGHPVCPAPGEQGESVWFAARPRYPEGHPQAGRVIHSAKPEIAYRWVEKHWANTPKIELNARRRRPGWHAWGNEADSSEAPQDAAAPEGATAIPVTARPKDVAGAIAAIRRGQLAGGAVH